MNQKQKIIIAYHRKNKSQRRIAREIGLNRRTVARYIKDYDRKRTQLLADNNNPAKEELIADIIQEPGYDASSRKKVKLTAEIMEKIQFYLQENEKKKKEGKGKQQRKKIDIMRHYKKKDLILAIPPSVTPFAEFNKNPGRPISDRNMHQARSVNLPGEKSN